MIDSVGDADCYSCREAGVPGLPPRAAVLRTAHWRVVHTFEGGLPGWLIAIPLRHRTAIAQLTSDEAAELGPLLRDLSIALGDELGCLKTYVMQFAEAPGFGHVHFHVVPRMSDQPPELTGPRIFAALTGRATDDATLASQDRLAEALTARLHAVRRQA